jgi:hypothetical protein
LKIDIPVQFTAQGFNNVAKTEGHRLI